jgi:predicted amidohydrolase
MNGTVAACQFEPAVGDPRRNVDRIADLVDDLDGAVRLAVFPELCVTGYDLDAARELAAPVPGSLTDPLVDVAEEYDVQLVVGLPERDGSDLYNDLVLVTPGGVRERYRKRYRWGTERDVFDRGDGPVAAETAVGRAGLAICYDLNFPEVALAYASRDCDLLAVSAAWRTEFREDWELLLRARALDGPTYAVGSNHTGAQRGRDHAGTSLVAGPDGKVLSNAGADPGSVTAAVDQSALEAARDRNPVRETRQRLAEDGRRDRWL